MLEIAQKSLWKKTAQAKYIGGLKIYFTDHEKYPKLN